MTSLAGASGRGGYNSLAEARAPARDVPYIDKISDTAFCLSKYTVNSVYRGIVRDVIRQKIRKKIATMTRFVHCVKCVYRRIYVVCVLRFVCPYAGLYTTNIPHNTTAVGIVLQRGPEKTAQTLMRYNFSTAGHRVTRFPAKCSETNW